jgi:hypothetical protein
VGRPEKISEREYACRVFCPLIGEPAYIRSLNPEHAYFLAFRFVKDMTEDFALTDRNGNAMELVCPPMPPLETGNGRRRSSSKDRGLGGARRISMTALRQAWAKPFRKTCIARRPKWLARPFPDLRGQAAAGFPWKI